MVEPQTKHKNHYIVKGKILLRRDKIGFNVQYVTRKSGSNRYDRELVFWCRSNDTFFHELKSFMNTYDTGELLQEHGLCVRHTTIKFYTVGQPIIFLNTSERGELERFLISSGTYFIESVEHKRNTLTNRLGVFM